MVLPGQIVLVIVSACISLQLTSCLGACLGAEVSPHAQDQCTFGPTVAFYLFVPGVSLPMESQSCTNECVLGWTNPAAPADVGVCTVVGQVLSAGACRGRECCRWSPNPTDRQFGLCHSPVGSMDAQHAAYSSSMTVFVSSSGLACLAGHCAFGGGLFI